MEAYEGASGKPIISTTKNSFKITLPNVNVKSESKSIPTPIGQAVPVSAQELDDKEQQVLEYVRKHGTITRPEAEKVLGMSASTASRLIKKMVRAGLLLQHGKARNIRYTAAE